MASAAARGSTAAIASQPAPFCALRDLLTSRLHAAAAAQS